MIKDGKIWLADNDKGESIFMLPKMANRHGLVAGATGTGKTVTLKVMTETFSDMGVPVFIADVKGDVAGLLKPGVDSEDMRKRIAKFGLADCGFSYKGYPTTIWDVYGEKGIQLRTTISEMGPLLLARILELNDLQTDILSVIFKIADDNDLLLIDTKDLKAMLAYVDSHSADFQAEYGKISSASVGVITRALVALESQGGDVFFGEPALKIQDFMTVTYDGKGMVNILDSSALVSNTKLYSTFLLWMISELYETMPEVGDPDKPKLVFFFDEAHLLFKGASNVLLEKIEQMVKLIRSKGIGVYFCTQNPKDIPNGVLSQLGNKIEHGLRAYTPADQKAAKAAAESFRINPEFNTYETILSLGTGEAVVSFLDEKGIPGITEKAKILPPQSLMGPISDAERESCVKGSLLYTKYAEAHDPDSAYEFLVRRGLEEQAEAEAAAAALAEQREAEKAEKQAKLEAEKAEKQAKAEADRAEREAQKAAEKAELAAQREAEKQAKAEAAALAKAEAEKKKAEEKKKKQQMKVAQQVGNSVAGTVGRELGKNVGSQFGSFGKTLGGNVGASLGRGLLSTLFASKK